MEWLKVQWKWVVAGLAVLGAFLLGVLLRRRPTPLPPVDETQKRVEEETEAKERVLEEKKNAEVESIEKARVETIKELTEEQKQRYEELKDKPDELSGWLIGLGQKNRS